MEKEDQIRKLLKPRNLLILGTATVIYLTIAIFQITALAGKSYVLTKLNLFQIDSVTMFSRAFVLGGGKSSSKTIEFNDMTHKTFWISGPRYLTITDFSKLYDTLQYSGVIMKIFTDKEGYNNYFDKRNEDIVDVYEIEIDNKSYISLDKINIEERKRHISFLIFSSIAYFIYLSIVFGRSKSVPS